MKRRPNTPRNYYRAALDFVQKCQEPPLNYISALALSLAYLIVVGSLPC